MKYDYDIIVIGAGAAGLSVALGAVQLGAKVMLIEKDHRLGGDCLWYGCVPSKSLIKSAKVAHQIKNAAHFGLPDLLSKKELKLDWKKINKRIFDIQKKIEHHADSIERFEGMGVDVRIGTARFLDSHTIQLKNKKITAKHFVIATGSRPKIYDVPGLQENGFITNMEMFTLPKQPKSLLVVGGGPIGSEMAQAMARLGTKVYIVERRDHVLSREDADMAQFVMDAFKNDGIEVLTGSTLVRVKKSKNGKKIAVIEKLQGAKRGKSIEVDEILISTGRQPNVENLGLEEIGISFSSKGIETNAKCQTNRKHIYAAGDVNGKYQFTHVAGAEAGIVISNMMFKFPKKMNYNLVPWATYTDPELASVGLNETRAKATNVKYEKIEFSFENQDRALAEGENHGKIKILIDKKKRILGAQIAGPHAGELIHEFVIAMNAGLKLGDIVGSIHAYPTLAESAKQAAGKFYSKKLFSSRTRWIIKNVFGFGKQT